jgi:hypothetical protein
MLQLDAARAMDCHTYALRGARNHRLKGYNNQIFPTNITEEFLVCSSGTKIKIG